MLTNSTIELEALEPDETTPEVGTVLDDQYELLQELAPVSGRPCFLAQSLSGGDLIELVVTNARPGRVRYLVRSCSTAHARRPPQSCSGERALSTFQERVALTGVSIRCNDRVVFHGWDRVRQRPVRVVVEPLD